MNIRAIAALHQHCTRLWHISEPRAFGQGFLSLVVQNHLENFQLWHAEDAARRDDLGAEAVRQAKRAIDGYNQQRNDLIEQMDLWLIQELRPAQSGCSFNSETPGMIIDRLSILALKVFHMQEETIRKDATDEHKARCSEKLDRLHQQRADLLQALAELAAAVRQGDRSFHVYRQFKMYNDAELNPQLRAASSREGAV